MLVPLSVISFSSRTKSDASAVIRRLMSPSRVNLDDVGVIGLARRGLVVVGVLMWCVLLWCVLWLRIVERSAQTCAVSLPGVLAPSGFGDLEKIGSSQPCPRALARLRLGDDAV